MPQHRERWFELEWQQLDAGCCLAKPAERVRSRGGGTEQAKPGRWRDDLQPTFGRWSHAIEREQKRARRMARFAIEAQCDAVLVHRVADDGPGEAADSDACSRTERRRARYGHDAAKGKGDAAGFAE